MHNDAIIHSLTRVQPHFKHINISFFIFRNLIGSWICVKEARFDNVAQLIHLFLFQLALDKRIHVLLDETLQNSLLKIVCAVGTGLEHLQNGRGVKLLRQRAQTVPRGRPSIRRLLLQLGAHVALAIPLCGLASRDRHRAAKRSPAIRIVEI